MKLVISCNREEAIEIGRIIGTTASGLDLMSNAFEEEGEAFETVKAIMKNAAYTSKNKKGEITIVTGEHGGACEITITSKYLCEVLELITNFIGEVVDPMVTCIGKTGMILDDFRIAAKKIKLRWKSKSKVCKGGPIVGARAVPKKKKR